MDAAAILAPDHVLREAVVFDELRLVYVPVPKAASTAILWALSGLAGLTAGDFSRSRKLEVTRALTVHDHSIWGASRRLDDRRPEDAAYILSSTEWFRFTVVREPIRRLWSAWVSKLLLREPRFMAAYGEEDWFPAVPRTADDVVDSFRRFVRALPAQSAGVHDRHWRSQSRLVGLPSISYDHVGRVERLQSTHKTLAEFVRRHGLAFPEFRSENPTVLAFAPALLDDETRDACERWTERDREVFGYGPLPATPPVPDTAWRHSVEAAIPAVQAVIERNERIADLCRLLTGRSRKPKRRRSRLS